MYSCCRGEISIRNFLLGIERRKTKHIPPTPSLLKWRIVNSPAALSVEWAISRQHLVVKLLPGFFYFLLNFFLLTQDWRVRKWSTIKWWKILFVPLVAFVYSRRWVTSHSIQLKFPDKSPSNIPSLVAICQKAKGYVVCDPILPLP